MNEFNIVFLFVVGFVALLIFSIVVYPGAGNDFDSKAVAVAALTADVVDDSCSNSLDCELVCNLYLENENFQSCRYKCLTLLTCD